MPLSDSIFIMKMSGMMRKKGGLGILGSGDFLFEFKSIINFIIYTTTIFFEIEIKKDKLGLSCAKLHLD